MIGSGKVEHGRPCRIEKAAGVRTLFETLGTLFSAAAAYPEDLSRHTSPVLPSRQSSSLLVSYCPPLGWLDVSGIVDVEGAPYLALLPGFPPTTPTPASHC
jgi:hypothetical protein